MLEELDRIYEDQEELTWQLITATRLLEEYANAMAGLTNCTD